MKSSAKKVELAPYDDLFSTEESRQDAKLEKIQEIPLSELHPFKNHPFEVKDDEAMMETADSVRQYTAPLLPSDLKGDTAEQLFYRFNNEHPADYRHPSMSVSDIVAIKRDGKVTERTIHKTKQHRPPKHQRSGAAFVVFQFFLGLPGLGPARRSCEPPRIVQTAQKESLSRNIQF